MHVNANVAVFFLLHLLLFFSLFSRAICRRFNAVRLHLFQLDLQLQDEMGGDLSSFVTNGEWELLGMYTRTRSTHAHSLTKLIIP